MTFESTQNVQNVAWTATGRSFYYDAKNNHVTRRVGTTRVRPSVRPSVRPPVRPSVRPSVTYGSYTSHIRLFEGYSTSYKLCLLYFVHFFLKTKLTVFEFCQESLKTIKPQIFVTPSQYSPFKSYPDPRSGSQDRTTNFQKVTNLTKLRYSLR